MNCYNVVNKKVLRELENIVGKNNLIVESEAKEDYSHDETPGLKSMPEVVVKPQSEEEVSEVLALCNKEKIPVTPRGGGTGLVGGAVPIYGGVVLSLVKMNKIIEIDPENLMAVVKAGVLLLDLHRETEKFGLFYPPLAEETGTIGGNIMTNAGGMRAIKYGVTRDYVKGMEVVLPDGEIINVGENNKKCDRL